MGNSRMASSRTQLVRDFGLVEGFKKQFNAATVGIQGSRWGWLGYNPTKKILEIVTTPNQDLSSVSVRVAVVDQSCQSTRPHHCHRHLGTCASLFPLSFYSWLTFHSRPFIKGLLLRNLNMSPHSPLFTCQYKNVKADVCPPVSTLLW